MKKKIRVCLSLFFITIFVLNSCKICDGIGDKMRIILGTDNSNWEADEINLTYSFYYEKNEFNAYMQYKNQEYYAIANADYNSRSSYSLYFWFYNDEIYNEDNYIGSITFRADKVIDDNTFTVVVDGSDFEIPQKITFHRIEQS